MVQSGQGEPILVMRAEAGVELNARAALITEQPERAVGERIPPGLPRRHQQIAQIKVYPTANPPFGSAETSLST